MKREEEFNVQTDKQESLCERIDVLYAKEIAALPTDTSPYVSYFREGGRLIATVTFVYAQSSQEAEFEYKDGVWKRSRDWND
ncbi:hypothetical protein PWR63_00720 [Paraburkholderia sp. A2WS-5]|uniref:hypothetical protein n=1 Tax=unclassified Paraburkholderia TaxID=2615204 RepID=UPI003B7F83EC